HKTVDRYFIANDTVTQNTTKHTEILNREPDIMESLFDVISTQEIVKVMPVAKDENEKQKIITAFAPFADTLSLQWGIHPTALPLQFGIITAQNISKKHAALTIAKHTGIPLEQTLGVGDGMSDWNFMELCGFAGIMGNASEELKRIAATKGEGNYYIGPSVNENGLLKIFEHFGLRHG
ncbi:MAG: HAD hydrolase family protein, partial [Patescibacteria group bacterium]